MQGGQDLDPGRPLAAPWWRTASSFAMCGFLLASGFYLAIEHTAHLFGALPFLLILACPLMHLLHHHGHGRDTVGRSLAREPALLLRSIRFDICAGHFPWAEANSLRYLVIPVKAKNPAL